MLSPKAALIPTSPNLVQNPISLGPEALWGCRVGSFGNGLKRKSKRSGDWRCRGKSGKEKSLRKKTEMTGRRGRIHKEKSALEDRGRKTEEAETATGETDSQRGPDGQTQAGMENGECAPHPGEWSLGFRESREQQRQGGAPRGEGLEMRKRPGSLGA